MLPYPVLCIGTQAKRVVQRQQKENQVGMGGKRASYNNGYVTLTTRDSLESIDIQLALKRSKLGLVEPSAKERERTIE
jgi:hypothetical protein